MTLARVVAEALVNATTIDRQSVADVAGLANGGLIVAWMGPDGSDAGVFAQLYGPGFQRLGGQVALNTTTEGRQSLPAVAGLADGKFVAVWTSAGQDGDGGGIFARRFDAAGVAVGGEMQLNQATMGDQGAPVVAPTPDGGFVAAWSSLGQDGGSYGIFARRYGGNGQPLGSEFQVNSVTANAQLAPAVAAFADGGFVVVWASDDQVSPTSDFDVFAQRYDADGVRLGGEFRINDVASGFQDTPAVATLADGRFVIAWESMDQDGSSFGIYARLYDAGGAAATEEFLVNTFTIGQQVEPDVAALPDGGFLIAWASLNQDGSSFGIFAQAYSPDGTREGAEFRVNGTVANDQGRAAVATVDGTGAAVAWDSFDPATDYDVFVAGYAEPVPVWRFYNNANGAHFFTVSTAERDAVIATLPSFRFEGAAFGAANAPYPDTAPVYRFYNTQNGAHFYTINEAEKNNVIATLPSFLFEGPNYNAYTAPIEGTVPLYRFYNVLTGAHFFTPNEAERANVIATLLEFRFEGVAYYVDPING